MFRPYGSLLHIVRFHALSENGGLAITQSNVAMLPPCMICGFASVSPWRMQKSEAPCRKRFIFAIAAFLTFFSCPKICPRQSFEFCM